MTAIPATIAAAPLAAGPSRQQALLDVRLVQITLEAENVVSLLLRGENETELPEWTPGAHVDLHLPSGLVRQYSLCGDANDRKVYRIAILKINGGRGGSLEVHDRLRVGQKLAISNPRNEFPLLDTGRYLFVAGGIGITPMLPMLLQAESSGADWRLLYAGRSRSRMAFIADLARLGQEKIRICPDDEGARPDLEAILAQAASGCEIYACGPQGMLDALEESFAAAGLSKCLHIERFVAAPPPPLPGDGAIRVFLARSGGHVDVPADCSILEALRSAGHDLPSSCEQGFCGTCECGVLDGTPDHRDTLLNDKERLAGKVMMPCVSRAVTPTLTLDI